MSDLKPCPCGKRPDHIPVHSLPPQKYSQGSCPCHDWRFEFHTQYERDEDKIDDLAEKAWNELPRADKNEAEIQRIVEEAKAKLPSALPGSIADQWHKLVEKEARAARIADHGVTQPVAPEVSE